VRAEFEHQAALDWKTFLSLRATELRPDGRLVVALPSLADDGTTTFATIMDHANVVLSELTIAGVITAEERPQMTLASCPRRQCDLLAPFADHGQFQGLVVKHCATLPLADTAWDEYHSTKTQRNWRGSAPGFFARFSCLRSHKHSDLAVVRRNARHFAPRWKPALNDVWWTIPCVSITWSG
jgi:hypothetical protein